MDTIEALNYVTGLLGVAANANAAAQKISDMIDKAKAEGRTTFTDEEWKELTDADAAARKALADAIAAGNSAP